MRTLPLTAKAYVTLDGNGDGTAYTGPLSPGEVWSGLTVSVSVATNNAEATCSIYAGAAATPGYFADATTWGSTGDSTQNVGTVRVGGNVFASWKGGDPGAKATMTITGTRQVA
jgi:hypothetical protein